MAADDEAPKSPIDPAVESTLNAGGPPPSSRSIGTVVAGGKYRVERVLGRGGMGVVLLGRHVALGEAVAIKFLSREANSDPAAAERFLREARSALKIKGEHVVRILDVGSEGDVPYMVMEYLEGRDLGKVLADDGPLSIHDAVFYVLQACEALAEAHSAGIVHRDLKPSNLFLTTRPDGTPLVKVLDFGIAKARPEEGGTPTLTDTRTVFGSPAYMSPEQIRSAKSVDARADLWALGIILYELLTGLPPFRGPNTMAVLASAVADVPAPIASLRADVPRALAEAIHRCLEKDVEQRTQSVLELALAIAPFAPPGQVSTDRIRRLTERRSPSLPDASRANTALSAPASSITISATSISTTSNVTRPSAGHAVVSPEARHSDRRNMLVAGLIIALVGAGGAVLGARARGTTKPAGEASVSRAVPQSAESSGTTTTTLSVTPPAGATASPPVPDAGLAAADAGRGLEVASPVPGPRVRRSAGQGPIAPAAPAPPSSAAPAAPPPTPPPVVTPAPPASAPVTADPMNKLH